MLNAERNATLTSVGKGTPMGELLRLYWMPVMPSADLAPGAKPTRIRLLGEDLVIARSAAGEVSMLAARCPHRGAPMAYSRNEECGLRCIYHGWLFSSEGACVEMPNEARSTQLINSVRIGAYPCRERNGVIWGYMGPDDEPPQLPDVEWNMVPADQVFVSVRVQHCNWVQALEGEIDSSHAPILHGRVDGGGLRTRTTWDDDLDPRLEVRDTPYGVAVAARRDTGASSYWRINQFLMPFYTLVPPTSPYPNLSGHAWVPMDDTTTLTFMFSYQPAEPLPEKVVNLYRNGPRGRESGHMTDHGHLTGPEADSKPFGRYWPVLSAENDYGYNPEYEASHFSALPGLWVQDAACQEGMGAIVDRSVEHLGSSDSGIIRMRRTLLDAAAALQERGERPPSATDPAVYSVRAASPTLPVETDWVAGSEPFTVAAGDFGYDIL